MNNEIKSFRERMQDKLDKMRKQVEDESIPLYKREQLVFKIRELKGKLHPKTFWDSSKKGTYRKRKSKYEE